MTCEELTMNTSNDEIQIRLEIEELEERIAPSFLGGGNSAVDKRTFFFLPNGREQDWPSAASGGLDRAVAGG